MQITDCTSKFVIFETQHIFDPHASLNMERGIPHRQGEISSPHRTQNNLLVSSLLSLTLESGRTLFDWPTIMSKIPCPCDDFLRSAS